MDAARARQNESNNRSFADGIARDRVAQLYPADLYRGAATSLLGGDQAMMQSRLIPEQERTTRSAYRLDSARNLTGEQEQLWAWTPDNIAARRTLTNDRYQSPAASLQVAAETYGLTDPVARTRRAAQTLARYPGALSAIASESPHYANTIYSTITDSLLSGQPATAQAFLRANGLGTLEPQADGRYVLRDPYGNASAPMAAPEIGMVLQSRMQQPATGLQGYAGAQRQAAQSAALERIKQEGELAKDDREALNKVRLKLLELQGDPMSTPETRTATLQAARDLGFNIGGGASAGVDAGLAALGLSSGGAPANAELITGATRRPPIPDGGWAGKFPNRPLSAADIPPLRGRADSGSLRASPSASPEEQRVLLEQAQQFLQTGRVPPGTSRYPAARLVPYRPL